MDLFRCLKRECFNFVWGSVCKVIFIFSDLDDLFNYILFVVDKGRYDMFVVYEWMRRWFWVFCVGELFLVDLIERGYFRCVWYVGCFGEELW